MIYENARSRAFSKMNLFHTEIFLLFAFRADTVKKDVVTGKIKPMGIPNPTFKTADKIHVHIKDAPTYSAFHVTVIAADMVKPIGAPRNLKTADFPHLR